MGSTRVLVPVPSKPQPVAAWTAKPSLGEAERPAPMASPGRLTAPAAPRIGHDFGRIAVRAPAGTPRHIASGHDDPFEREADRIAEAVVDMPQPAGAIGAQILTTPVSNGAVLSTQRKAIRAGEAPGDVKDEEEEQGEEGEEEEEAAAAKERRKQGPPGGPEDRPGPAGEREVAPKIERGIRGKEGQGAPLPEPTRAFFEARFGSDFSRVRVHADEQSATMARGLKARAFTRAQDIFFGAGQYRPEAPAGRKLIAHELAHALQQGGVKPPGQPRTAPVSAPAAATAPVSAPAAAAAPEEARVDVPAAEAPAATPALLEPGGKAPSMAVEVPPPAAAPVEEKAAEDKAAALQTAAPPEKAAPAPPKLPEVASAGAAAAAPAAPAVETGAAPGAEPEAEGPASPEAEAVEEKMDAAQPEEEAAAEAQVDGEEEAAEGGGAAEEAQEDASARAEAAASAGPEAATPAEAGPPAAAETDTGAAATPEPDRGADAGAAGAREQQAEAAPPPEPAAEEAAEGGADEGTLSPAERDAALSTVSESVEGGEVGGGGGGGGAAIPDKPPPEVPDVSQAPPEAALASAGALPPAQLGQALGGVAQSIGRTVGERRAELAEAPPSMAAPTGMPAVAAPRGPTPDAGGTAKKKPNKVPEGKAAPPPAIKPAPAPPPTRAERVAAPALSGGGGGLTADDAARVQASIDSMPTTDPALITSAGPPPDLALSGNADPGQADAQQAEVDAAVAQAHQAARADATQPMGEAEIAPVASKDTLKAKVGAGGGGGAKAPDVGGANVEAASLIAEEQSGGEIRAAVAQAQAGMAEAQETERRSSQAEREKTRAQIDAEVQASAEAQRAEKGRALKDVAAQRSAWTEAQRAAVDKGRADADAKLSDVHGKVSAEKRKAENTAVAHLAKGERDARAAKADGEANARQAKAKATSQSRGILGWLADKAKALFDEVKAGIKAALDAARRAVKAAIDAAKKLAVEAIEAARQTVVAAIRAAGDALIAIGDTVLAAFPAARAKFRKAIEDRVRAAEDAVNRIADDLKKGAQKLLDGLGAFLDAALGLFGKALEAALDAVASVVSGALKAAQAALDALGVFAQLAVDVVSNPLRWLSYLGAAVVDGIKNHLWKALKAAIAEWFNQKLEAVLGLGTAIFDLLFKGGISLAAVGKMAWEALKAAIPGVLIQILVEKLVSMIVPAAGAVMVIVEGLMAAWGTVGRILQAIDRFIAFLKAVKSGAAGAKFADAVAAAAVAVIDFVANWLIARLRRPAGKVAGKLRAIAQKILAKIKKALKKVGKALKKAGSKVKGLFKRRKKKGGKSRGRDRMRDTQPEALWLGPIGDKLRFVADGHAHRLWVAVSGQNATLMVASREMGVSEQIASFETLIAKLTSTDTKTKAMRHLNQARAELKKADDRADQLARAKKKGGGRGKGKSGKPSKATLKKLDRELKASQSRLSHLLAELFHLVGAPESDSTDWRARFAQAKSKFDRRFNTKKWAKAFKISVRSAQRDMQEGTQAKPQLAMAIEAGGEYCLLPLPTAELIKLGSAEALARGRSSSILYKGDNKPFDLADLKSFLLSRPTLPKHEGSYTQAVLEAIADKMVAAKDLSVKEVKGAKRYYFEKMPSQRHLPKSWTGEDVRNKYYINGSGFGSMRDRVRAEGIARIGRVIDLFNNGKQEIAVDRWEALHDEGLVIDRTFIKAKARATGDGYLNLDNMDADHVTPLAKHWKMTGFNCDWSERKTVAGGLKNLQPLHYTNNRSKGAEGAGYMQVPYVGPNFTGPGTSRGIWYADESTLFDGAPR